MKHSKSWQYVKFCIKRNIAFYWHEIMLPTTKY